MLNDTIRINVSDVWQKYRDGEDEITLELFTEEISLILASLSIKIGEILGEDSQMQYDDIVYNISQNANDEDEFDYHWNELLDWADDYSVVIETY